MAKAKAKNKQTLISPVGIAHYAYVWKAQINRENPDQEPKFSITVVIPKKTGKDWADVAIKEAASKKFGPKGLLLLKRGKLQTPIRDGDEDREVDPLYKGKFFFSAKSTQPPGVVDPDRQPIEDQFDFYSGCKCRVSIYAYGYDVKGNKGVAFSLNNVQKIADGERLSGRGSAEDDFDDGEDFGSDEEDDEDDERPSKARAKSKSKASRDEEDDEDDSDDSDDSDDDEDEDDEPAPRKKSKSSKRPKDEDEDDEDEDDEDEDDEDEEDEDPPPRRRRH